MPPILRVGKRPGGQSNYEHVLTPSSKDTAVRCPGSDDQQSTAGAAGGIHRWHTQGHGEMDLADLQPEKRSRAESFHWKEIDYGQVRQHWSVLRLLLYRRRRPVHRPGGRAGEHYHQWRGNVAT